MSKLTYDPESDIWANREIKKDYTKMILDRQVLNRGMTLKEKTYLESEAYKRKQQLCKGLGFKNPIFWLFGIGGIYFGGLIQARKQFINGGNYFFNSKFDLVAARKQILLGYFVGSAIGCLAVGQPNLVKEWFRGYINLLFKVPVNEKPFYKTREGFHDVNHRVDVKTIFDFDE